MDIIFPPRCIFCRRILSSQAEQEICGDCFKKIPFTAERALSYNEDKLDRAICACDYSGIIREALLRLKFRDRPGYSRALSGILARVVEEEYGGLVFDLVISVPLHNQRKRDRGYNQALLLSRELSRGKGIKEASYLMERCRSTEAQSLLDRDKRADNIKGAFRVKKPEEVCGKRILLIDDIMTTGNTLNECARALKEAGAAYAAAAVVAASKKK
jgi:ComF family protein